MYVCKDDPSSIWENVRVLNVSYQTRYDVCLWGLLALTFISLFGDRSRTSCFYSQEQLIVNNKGIPQELVSFYNFVVDDIVDVCYPDISIKKWFPMGRTMSWAESK